MALSTIQAQFCEEHNVASVNVMRLARLANRRALYATHECNGDPYHNVDPKDKDACSQAWGKDVEQLDKEILALAQIMGFSNVDFGSGLYPTLIKGKHTYHIPF